MWCCWISPRNNPRCGSITSLPERRVLENEDNALAEL